jgi:hypothetical protein
MHRELNILLFFIHRDRKHKRWKANLRGYELHNSKNDLGVHRTAINFQTVTLAVKHVARRNVKMSMDNLHLLTPNRI